MNKDDDKEPEEPGTLISINGEIIPGSNLRITQHRRGEPITHRESGVVGSSSEAAATPEGSVVSQQRGTPAQGEGRTFEACRMLAAVWRDRGQPWLHVSQAGPHDDCDCIGFHGENPPVRIQLVRADSSPDAYRALARDGEFATMSPTAEPRADVLRAAIKKKADRIPVVQRQNLILALDATTASVYALGPVVRSFRDQFESWAAGLNFAAIWLVGPNNTMTYRLDAKDAADRA